MDQQIDGEFHKEHEEFWEKFIKSNVAHFKQYHETIIREAKAKKAPVYFIRYEDLVVDPKSVIENVFAFFLNIESVEGTCIQKRIHEILNLGHEASVSYKPKTIGLHKNRFRFNDELIKYIQEELKDFIYYFGYNKLTDKEHQFAFYKYDEQSESDLSQFEAFKKQNEESMNWCLTDPESLKKIEYVVNRPDDLLKVDRPYYPEIMMKVDIKL